MGEKKKGKVIEIGKDDEQVMMEEEEEELDDKITKADNQQGDHHHFLLTRLPTQLETIRGDGKLHQPELSADPESEGTTVKVKRVSEISSEMDGGGSNKEEEMIKELRNLKRQNFITHCLLSAMLVLTVGWQLSQVSLILKVREGLNHPFKSFGSMLGGMLKKGPKFKVQDGEGETSNNKKHKDDNLILEVPELPNMDLSGLVFTRDEN